MQILYNLKEGGWVWGGGGQAHPKGHAACNSYDEGEERVLKLWGLSPGPSISNYVLAAGFMGHSDPWCSCSDTAAGPALRGNPDLSVLRPPIPLPGAPPAQVKPLITHLQASGW